MPCNPFSPAPLSASFSSFIGPPSSTPSDVPQCHNVPKCPQSPPPPKTEKSPTTPHPSTTYPMSRFAQMRLACAFPTPIPFPSHTYPCPTSLLSSCFMF